MGTPVIERATLEDVDAITALNVAAYREFSERMTSDGWLSMKDAVESVEARFGAARFPVVRRSDGLLGSVAPRNGLRYCRYKLSLDPVAGLEEAGQ